MSSNILKLPGELQNLIIQDLDPASRIYLKLTCRYFHNMLSLSRTTRSLNSSYGNLYATAVPPNGSGSGGLAKYANGFDPATSSSIVHENSSEVKWAPEGTKDFVFIVASKPQCIRREMCLAETAKHGPYALVAGDFSQLYMDHTAKIVVIGWVYRKQSRSRRDAINSSWTLHLGYLGY